MSFFVFSVFYNPVFYFFLGVSLVVFAPSSVRDAVRLGLFSLVLLLFAGVFQFVVERFWLLRVNMLALRLVVFFVGFAFILLGLFYLGRRFFAAYVDYFYSFIKDGSIIGLVMGSVFIVMDQRLSFLQSVFAFFSAGVGVLVALVVFVGICRSVKERIVPVSMRGFPLRLLSAGFVSMFFMIVGRSFLSGF